MKTITIEDGVFAELQRQAAETGSTISRLIEAAVKRTAPRRAEEATPKRSGSIRRSGDDEADRSHPPSPKESFRLVTFGRGGQFSPYDVTKTSALLEILHEAPSPGAPGRHRGNS